jgi:hypothetical protein
MAWKYTLPAFVLPFVFVTDPEGWACCSRCATA